MAIESNIFFYKRKKKYVRNTCTMCVRLRLPPLDYRISDGFYLCRTDVSAKTSCSLFFRSKPFFFFLGTKVIYQDVLLILPPSAMSGFIKKMSRRLVYYLAKLFIAWETYLVI